MDPQEITNRYHLDVYNRFPITLVKGKGTRVWDDDGNEYLDALAGIAVNSIGHCHPNVVKAIQEQAEKLMHISNFYYSEPQARLVELLAKVSGLDRVFLCNSGAESIEAALKLARKYGKVNKKQGPVITMDNAFHGRTMATISMGMEKYSKGYDPLLSGFMEIPMNDIQALEKAFEQNPLALILEPIQGSGGLHIVSPEFADKVQELCRQHNTLLIIDEVQTGMGRTGKMFGFEHFELEPDIISCAKAMGGGFPVGAMMAKESVASAMKHGDHGTTYGGNPLACAAAFAALQTIREDNLPDEASKKGSYLINQIREKTKGLDCIHDIRGKGLMIGVELSFPGRPVVEEMLQRGVLSNCTHGNVMRLVPPLIISSQEIDLLANTLSDSIKAVQ
ncbi:MAG: aspartate aminotransferase family protein [Balneolaceae bacterium]|nr:aspartate aminotransferase family protein [Balneolaceae bacterium]